MTLYIQSVDITPEFEVVVFGYASATNINVSLSPVVYVTPPADGIWDFHLNEHLNAPIGATIITPFVVRAPHTNDPGFQGVRVHAARPPGDSHSVLRRAARKVATLTSSSQNDVWVVGARYRPAAGIVEMEVEYSGGCFEHDFRLEWDGSLLKSNPPQVTFNLVNASDKDPCREVIRRVLTFDVHTAEFSLPNLDSAWIIVHGQSPMVPAPVWYPATMPYA